MPLVERLQRLVEGLNVPIAAFAPDGMLVRASDAAHALPGFRNLSDADLKAARGEALRRPRRARIAIGTLVLQRLGSGADIGLVALIEPKPDDDVAAAALACAHAADETTPISHHGSGRRPAPAWAGFDLIDEFAEPAAEPAEATPPRFDMAMPMPPSHFIKTVADAPATGAIAAPTAPPCRRGPASRRSRGTIRCASYGRWMPRGRFSLGSDEFTRTDRRAHRTATLGRLWSENRRGTARWIPKGLVDQAIATHDTLEPA